MHDAAPYPDWPHAPLMERVDYAPDAHEWEGKEDDAGEHHGLLRINFRGGRR